MRNASRRSTSHCSGDGFTYHADRERVSERHCYGPAHPESNW